MLVIGAQSQRHHRGLLGVVLAGEHLALKLRVEKASGWNSDLPLASSAFGCSSAPFSRRSLALHDSPFF